MVVEIVWSKFRENWLRIEGVRGAIVKTTNFDEILIRALSSANSCNQFPSLTLHSTPDILLKVSDDKPMKQNCFGLHTDQAM
jgi:hypothetical protein